MKIDIKKAIRTINKVFNPPAMRVVKKPESPSQNPAQSAKAHPPKIFKM